MGKTEVKLEDGTEVVGPAVEGGSRRRWSWSRCCSWAGAGAPGLSGGGLLLTFPDTVGTTLDDGDLGVVGETVEQGGDASGVGTLFQFLKARLVVSRMERRAS